ncbi:MAG: hypothetical protein GY861_18530 [bacterium]|nr:hypothetical protein [bacterium]
MTKGSFVQHNGKTIFYMKEVCGYKVLEAVLEAAMNIKGTLNIYIIPLKEGFQVEVRQKQKIEFRFTAPTVEKVCHDIRNWGQAQINIQAMKDKLL